MNKVPLLLVMLTLTANRAFCDLVDEGIAKYGNRDYDGAIADYTKAIERNPNYAIAYSCRGNAKQAEGDIGGAIADYTKAIKLKPDYAFAYYNRGNAKRVKGDYDGAIVDFTKAIERTPTMHSHTMTAAMRSMPKAIVTVPSLIGQKPSN